MKLILSPSKTMEDNFRARTEKDTAILYPKRTSLIMEQLKSLKAEDIGEIMKVNEKIAQLNAERFKTLNTITTKGNNTFHIYKGEVYTGLNSKEFTVQDMEWAQDKCFILSALYGVLRPNDFVQPYRLEMGISKFKFSNQSLYDYWKNDLSSYFQSLIHSTSPLINLASDEYFKVIKSAIDPNNIISIEFRELRQGELKFVSTNAKKARGLLANYIIKNRLTNPSQLKKFDVENYSYSKDLSSTNTMYFIR
jgi:uncharacterized protein